MPEALADTVKAGNKRESSTDRDRLPVPAAGEGGVAAAQVRLLGVANQQVLHVVWIHEQRLLHAVPL